MTKIDRYIIARLLSITVMILLVLIFIFIAIDFSENSDDFSDRGATMAEIWGVYYINYIPEMIRLVSPVALFTAALLLTGQLADRVEIVALKGAGISLYRLLLPYLIVSGVIASGVSYLDAFIVPKANAERIQFERKYINNSSDRIDKNRTYRQLNDSTIIEIGYFDQHNKTAYSVYISTFLQDTLRSMTHLSKMTYVDSTDIWQWRNGERQVYVNAGIKRHKITELDTTMNIYPRDVARTTSDIYQMTYPEIVHYINAIERTGAGNIELPMVQFYSKASYPFSIIVVTIIGLCLASVRRKGGKGVYLALGLGISFIYLAFMKLMEPMGIYGVIPPLWAAIIPHLFFGVVALLLLLFTKK